MKTRFSTLIALFCSLGLTAQTATFNITFTGFTPQAQTAFQYAAGIWSNILVSPVPIKIIAHYQPLSPGMLGISFPNGRKNFSGAPLSDTWYVTSLANSLAGTELNPGETDIEIYFNSTQSWYFDTTGVGNCNQYDFVTVALHEICHGLGMLSVAKKTGTMGSFGLLQAADFAPLTTSFPWPNLDTLPSAFDRLLVNNLNQALDTFTNPSSALGTIFTGNNIFIQGFNTISANGGLPARIYAPSTFALGSSVTHLNESTFPAGNPNELMTPNGTTCYTLHNPGPIVIGILKDIGWTVNTTGISENAVSVNEFSVYPNPFRNEIYVSSLSSLSKAGEIVLLDITCKEIHRQRIHEGVVKLHMENISGGFYLLQCLNGKRTENFKVIKL